jgi:hypothetical protein
MKRMIAITSMLVMTPLLACAWQAASQTPAAQKPPSHKKAVLKKQNQAAAPVQQLPAQIMPPLPATLMNSAPVKPEVTMENGQLTIDAPNSTLSDVLSGIHRATGASIEGASPTERVAVKLGPGTPEQVIAALLRGTPYDYVILGTLGKQEVVARVLLTQQSNLLADTPQAPSGQTMGRPQQPAFQPPVDSIQPERTPPDEVAPATENHADQTPPTQPQQPNANTPKTPDQLFKELQQLQQQKQQPQ